MKITQFNQNNLHELRQEINTALNSVGTKYGLAIGLNTIRFDDNTFRATLEAAITDGTGIKDVKKTKYEQDFILFCRLYNLEKTDLGRTFTYQHKLYKIIGIDRSRKKYPIVCEDATGKIILFAESLIHVVLKKN